MKVRDFSKIFFSILFLHLVVIYKPESEILYMVSRPLLVFALLAFFLHKTSDFILTGKSWVPIALITFLVGDILFLNESDNLFLAGIAAFFLGQLFYILFYLNQKLRRNYTLLALGLAVIAAGGYMLYHYVRVPQGLTTYIYTYAAVAGLHLLASVRLWSAGKFVRLPVIGAVLLMISTGLLAYTKFNMEGDKYWHIATMLIYGAAQYLIVIGLIKYAQEKGEVSERPSA